MDKHKAKQLKRTRRKMKIRAKLSGTKERPRLSVFRSNKGMFVQLIDDETGKTLAGVGITEVKAKDKKTNLSFELGKMIAKKAADLKITNVVFDRSGYKYHGRVKALADGAREGGLNF